MKQLTVDYTFMQNTVWRLKAKYPVLQVKHIGKSVVGRSIYALEIGRSSAPAVGLFGTFWGTDSLGGRVLLQLTEQLLESLYSRTLFYGIDPVVGMADRKITVIPFVNPDGREICERGAHCGGVDSGRIRRLCGGDTSLWSANARGVDIPANISFGFYARCQRAKGRGIYGPSPWGYGGPFPESEPETAALTDFCRQQRLHHALCLFPGDNSVLWRTECITDRIAKKMAQVVALAGGYSVEADVGSMLDTGFRHWLAAERKVPALDVFTQSTVQPDALLELLAVSLIV